MEQNGLYQLLCRWPRKTWNDFGSLSKVFSRICCIRWEKPALDITFSKLIENVILKIRTINQLSFNYPSKIIWKAPHCGIWKPSPRQLSFTHNLPFQRMRLIQVLAKCVPVGALGRFWLPNAFYKINHKMHERSSCWRNCNKRLFRFYCYSKIQQWKSVRMWDKILMVGASNFSGLYSFAMFREI